MSPRLSKRDRATLDRCVWYLNLEEMRRFCRAHGLPLYIHLEGQDGKLRRSRDRDRKDVVIRRILDFAFRGEKTGPTVYRRTVVSNGQLPSRLTARTRIHYGQYEKKNPEFTRVLKELTGGGFRLGFIARLVLRDFWTAGTAPTLRQFAEAWGHAQAAHTEPRPEGAYLVDLAKGEAGAGWKELRTRNAKTALGILDRLAL